MSCWFDLDLGKMASGQGHEQPLCQVWASDVSSLKSYGLDTKMGRTDRQADMMIPIYPPNFVCGGYEYIPSSCTPTNIPINVEQHTCSSLSDTPPLNIQILNRPPDFVCTYFQVRVFAKLSRDHQLSWRKLLKIIILSCIWPHQGKGYFDRSRLFHQIVIEKWHLHVTYAIKRFIITDDRVKRDTQLITFRISPTSLILVRCNYLLTKAIFQLYHGDQFSLWKKP